jgi:hypothetical protein
MINYNIPSASLKYPLEQITVNITTVDLIKLHTSPFEILPSGYNYNVVNAYLVYDNFQCNGGLNLYIGYESLLNVALTSSFCVFDTINMNGINGNIGIGTRIQNLNTPSNSVNSQPLVLYQTVDDNTAQYFTFELTITYIKFP